MTIQHKNVLKRLSLSDRAELQMMEVEKNIFSISFQQKRFLNFSREMVKYSINIFFVKNIFSISKQFLLNRKIFFLILKKIFQNKTFFVEKYFFNLQTIFMKSKTVF